MIKRYWQITLRDYDIIEKTGTISHLKLWYNFLPVRLFVNRIAKELDELKSRLNEKVKQDETLKIELLRYEALSRAKIEAIRINLLGIKNILDLGTRVKSFKLSRQVRRKLKLKTGNLKVYIDNIKEYTGIEIKELRDIISVEENLEHKIDKYRQLLKKQEKQGDEKKVYLMSYALGVFSFLNQTLNVHLTVMEFLDARDKALEESKRLELKNKK